MITRIRVNGKASYIERMPDGGYMSAIADLDVAPNGAAEATGQSVDEVVGRLRAKGYSIETTPLDDGMIGYWEVVGQNSGGDSRWSALSEREANYLFENLPEQNPHLGSWEVRPMRISPEQFYLRNDNKFHPTWVL